ncbi:hypothetical protein JKP88DRAFT_241075 [Tribonema minus]|uniref:DNA sliding clamp PCNA n=1 Tax=Tribonema minus TaxID=303371 RepID=A0A835Z2Q5_9STRA|nr:hypothetical protein JKP88DRAFT_241075 [Tribonema minus]
METDAPEHDTKRNELGDVDDLPADCILMMRSTQTSQWRSIFDFVKDVTTEVPFKFDTEGLSIITLDPLKIALISVRAVTEFYYCKAPLNVGINVTVLYRLLRNLTSAGYVLEISMFQNETDVIHVQITNRDKRSVVRNKIKLLRLPDEVITIPSTTFDRVLSIPSSDLQRYIRELSSLSSKITVSSTRDELTLSAQGALGSSEITVRPTSSGVHFLFKDTEKHDEVVSARFYSRYLEKLCRPIDSSTEVFLKKGYPLVLRYNLATATIRVVIAPVNDDDES